MIPNEKSFMELDPVQRDRWGIPVPRFHFEWSDHEIRQVEHAQRTFAEMIEAAGGIVSGSPAKDGRKAMTTGGSVNHEIGVTRMSARPEDGVTNEWCQLWDCPNVMVVDGGVFVSNPYKNPTLTILALAWRACDHLLSEAKRGDLPSPV
jgi:choline dehydrogenase-like flavoprotein